jgi:transcriptional regulator with XRE-family HTH domain
VQEDYSPERVFATRLKEIRESLGLTQAALAGMLEERAGIGLDPTAITRIERGQRGIALGEACSITSVLGVGLGDMLKTDKIVRAEMLNLEIAVIESNLSAARRTIDEACEHEKYLQAKLADLRTALDTLTADAQDARNWEAATHRHTKVVTIRPKAPANPRSLIAENLRDGHAVVLDLNAAGTNAEPIAEFAAGVVLGQGGSIERTGGDDEPGQLLLLVPADIPLAAKDLARIESAVLDAVASGEAAAAAPAASTAWRKILAHQ